MKIETIAQAISLIYDIPMYAIHGNPDAMDMFCYVIYQHKTKEYILAGKALYISADRFRKCVMRGREKIAYQNMEGKYLGVMDTIQYLQNKPIENQ